MSKFIPQRKNANKHTQRGLKELENSIQRDGWIGAVTVAADGETFDGSARIETLANVMPDKEPIVIDVDGNTPVIVRRTDIPNADDPRAKRLAVAANYIASVDLSWDSDVLLELMEEDTQIAELLKQDAALMEQLTQSVLGQGHDENYSRKIEAPIYTPKGEKPKTNALFDDTRTKELIADIDASTLPDDEKQFLRIAAQRHTVLNFKLIADYYAHSEKPTQKLMEDSALVIIDFNRAIELGYVKLSKEIAEQYAQDYPDA